MRLLQIVATVPDEDMESPDLNEVIQSLGGHMIRARTRRVNDASIQFMNKPMGVRNQLKRNWLRLVILVQANEKGVSCGLVAPF